MRAGPRVTSAVQLLLLALLVGCPATNSKPCDSDADCPDGRCRRGACGPVCESDLDCGSEQVCSAGSCAARPLCQLNADCAQGFSCQAGQCTCLDDGACAANQTCSQGKCSARARCTTDAECAESGKRCELTQGLCISPCTAPADCAPSLDPTLATALYACTLGSCQRRCVSDATCGSGLICVAGTCEAATCKTRTDCPANQYCTSTTSGRCLDFTVCTSDSQCAKNFRCRAFAANTCPPGFDCSNKICQELPVCLIDGDCTAPSYCDEQHCQVSTRCDASMLCGEGFSCVAEVCVPAACRGFTDCPAGQGCVAGRCRTVLQPGDVVLLDVTPSRAVVEAGSSIKISVIGYGLDGMSYPLPSATFTVLDTNGNPSSAATVTPSGIVTGVTPGRVRLRVSLSGTSVVPREVSLTVFSATASGRSVRAIDAATLAPLAGVQVLGCEATACTTVTTDALGEALFPSLSAGPASFSVASPELRGDGLPRYERVSVSATTARDLLLPLGGNPVHAAAGFNGSLAFTDVHSSGSTWLGFAVLSSIDPSDLSLSALLGEPFNFTVPGLMQRLPVPGSVVLYTSPGLGIPNELKGKSYGLGQAGRRAWVGFAGKTDLTQIGVLRSLDVLAYAGSLDFAVAPFNTITQRPRVPDSADIDHDGVTGEEVPDYAQFTALSLKPSFIQQRRTEVVLPPLTDGFDNAIVAAVELTPELGVTPVGFSSRVAGAAGPNGSRTVAPLVLRSGAPYGGLEAGTPAIWSLAVQLAGMTSPNVDGNVSARLTRAAILPTRVVVAPFLPLASGSSYSAGNRTFLPGQPAWNAIASAGGALGRVVLTGSENRHVIYFELQSSQTGLRIPDAPAGSGADPAAQPTPALDVVVIDLADGVTPTDVIDLAGTNFSNLTSAVDGYSRFRG